MAGGSAVSRWDRAAPRLHLGSNRRELEGLSLAQQSNLTTQAVVLSDNGMYAASVVDTQPCLWTELPSGHWKCEIIGEPRSMVPRGQ